MKLTLIAAALLAATAASAQNQAATQTPEEQSRATEVWSPVPKAVDTTGSAPSDAVVLFGGDNLDQWQTAKDGSPAGWTVGDGALTVKAGTGDIQSKQSFCDVQLHVEWRTPTDITGPDGKELQSQDRNNSGVFLQGLYEVQVLDSYGPAKTYVNGQAGAVYKQSIPLVNASRAPGVWQAYDIIYHAPHFDASGAVTQKARITVLHNGVLVQDNFEIQGPTAWIGHPPYAAHGCRPISLQDHGHPVSYRNIWVRPLD
ncbi:MAG: DUF1080 domain-containing protein [Asticcacaulis sp.]